MSLLDAFDPAPFIRPMYNLGCLFDIPTGEYHVGEYGESILNAGLAQITGFGGRGNTFKSTMCDYMVLTVLDHFKDALALKYDTEMSASLGRYNDLAWGANYYLKGIDLRRDKRIKITDKTRYNGSKWYELLKEASNDRIKLPKSMMGRTPFLDESGGHIDDLIPFLAFIDSLSQFSTANVVKLQTEGEIGDSSRNVEGLRDAGAKTQMLMEMPTVCAANGIHLIMSAHMGDELALDPYAPPQKKLQFLKNKVRFKGVPDKFHFLTNNLWIASSTSVLNNQSTKAPEFPRNSDDDMKGDTDLMAVTLTLLRGKYGMSGLSHDVVVSQSDGVHRGLTEFLYLKDRGRFGISGNDRSYALDLCPDVNLSRTTVRGKIDEMAKVRRALEISSEMLQISSYWTDIPNGYLCTPKELFDDLRAKGYDWDMLLGSTRGWWTFDNANPAHELKFLSTYDLLGMRAGTYKPYWLQ